MRSSQHSNQSSGVYGIILLIFIVCIMMMIHQTANASHMLGAEMSYKHVDGQKYQVQYTLYRDCSGISAPSNLNLKISTDYCNYISFHSLELMANSGFELNGICPSMKSNCQGGNFTGVQVWKYSAEINLPFACSDWIFSVTDCCRNEAISNIDDPSSSAIYMEAFLDNTQGKNSLGEFTNSQQTYLTLGQSQKMDASVFDPDGDSLVYTLITPKTASNKNVNYLAPYDIYNPFGSEMQINAHTGQINITPQIIMTGVFSVAALEYRNGIHIGTISRDIQISIIASTNRVPELSGINGTNEYFVNACNNSKMSFDIYSKDQNPDQQLGFSWKTDLPYATLSTGTGLNPVITFKIDPAHIKPGKYFLSITVSDDACPFVASNSHIYSIYISDFTLQFKSQDLTCSDRKDGKITMIAMGGSSPYSYTWSDVKFNIAERKNLSQGEYEVLVTDDKGCSIEKKVSLKNRFETPLLSVPKYTYGCMGKTVNILASTTKDSYSWSTGASTNSIEVTASGEYTVEITNESGCSASASINVSFKDCDPNYEQIDSKESFSLYPNPVKDILNIRSNKGEIGIIHLTITDIRGLTIIKSLTSKEFDGEQSLDLSNLPAGVYILLIQSSTELSSSKFCKL